MRSRTFLHREMVHSCGEEKYRHSKHFSTLRVRKGFVGNIDFDAAPEQSEMIKTVRASQYTVNEQMVSCICSN